MINKLVAVIHVRVCDYSMEDGSKEGFGCVYFMDPNTKKLYKPNEGFEVTGENLEDKFTEFDDEKDDKWLVRAISKEEYERKYVHRIVDNSNEDGTKD